jgi:hypothetical protein
MMFGTMIFGVVHAEVTNNKAKKKPGVKFATALGDPFLVIIGSALGTAILLTMSDFGGPVGDFSVGLAGLTLLGSVLYGGPTVFHVIKGATAAPTTTPAVTPTKGKATP